MGRNARLERRVLALAERTDYPLRIVGFVDNVFDYMHASDVLVSKPGGLSSSEALSAALPMVLVKPLPGQEERNTRYLVSRRAAVRAEGEAQLARAIADIVEPGERRERLLQRIAPLRRPDAAADVARRIAGLIELRRAAGAR